VYQHYLFQSYATITGDQPIWAHKSKRYEFDQDFGDIGPAIPELEEDLFRGEFQMQKGIKFEK